VHSGGNSRDKKNKNKENASVRPVSPKHPVADKHIGDALSKVENTDDGYQSAAAYFMPASNSDSTPETKVRKDKSAKFKSNKDVDLATDTIGYSALPGFAPSAGFIEAQKLKQAAQFAQDEMFARHGFTNRVSIKGGVTASIAIFKYVGSDPDIQARTVNGFIMVKVPPLKIAEADAHAALTYSNEFKVVSKLGEIKCNSRPLLLAKTLDGFDCIFNIPVFYDEEKFSIQVQQIVLRKNALEKELADLNYKKQNSVNLSPAEEGAFYTEVSNLDKLVKETSDIEASLIKESFHNLSTYMLELGASGQDPEARIDKLFSSMIDAMNDLHNDHYLHLDIANRNFVVRNDGTAVLVDFGMSDSMHERSGKAITNTKFPQISLMYNQDALKQNDFKIDLRSDYVSMQKTMLQALADYCGANFYTLLKKGLGGQDWRGIPYVELLARFSDKDVIANAKKNLKVLARNLMESGDPRGEHVLHMLNKYKHYIKHEHSPNVTVREAMWDNNRAFRKCTLTSNVSKNPVEVLSSMPAKHHARMFERLAVDEVPPRSVAPVSRSKVSSAVEKYKQDVQSHYKNHDPHHDFRRKR
jgi:serine/threonine protein kinase